VTDSEIQRLVDAARRARDCSLSPFSNFCVGAAVETEDGRIYTGCNIESASFGLTVCAERVAIWKALSEGERKFKRLAVVVDTTPLTPPCGTCRQIIWEFCRDVEVVLANLSGDIETDMMSDLLPRAFDARFLNTISGGKKNDTNDQSVTEPGD
jgi:cytidine deaminase